MSFWSCHFVLLSWYWLNLWLYLNRALEDIWVLFNAGLFNLYLRKIKMSLEGCCRDLEDPLLPLFISLISRWPPPYHRSTAYHALFLRPAAAVRAHSRGVIGHGVIFFYDNLIIAVVVIIVAGFNSIITIVRGLVGLSTTCNTHQLHCKLSLLS